MDSKIHFGFENSVLFENSLWIRKFILDSKIHFGIEKIYRNSIDSVSKFLKERHKENYIVINLSGKKYDYSKFNNRVLEYEWVDHHAPPLKILFQICEKIQKFLSGTNNLY